VNEHTHGVLLTLAYDGAGYSGFARQTNARSVGGELEGAIRCIDPRASHLRAVSRTDAGVHARAQIASFDTTKAIDSRGWVLALVQQLPKDIAVVRAASVPVGFDPRHVAVRKTYRYSVLSSPTHDPFWHQRAWRVYERLNHSAIATEAKSLLGTHDFRAFRSAQDTRDNTVRTMLRADVTISKSDARIIEIEVEGDRFMHRMMRIICGTLVDVARGRLESGAVERAIASGRREDLGITAPPGGLCLERIVLSEGGAEPWPEPLIDWDAPLA
jgi:tRNA pseudouridine38-40 synthase